MKEYIEKWTAALLKEPDRIIGYAVSIVGNKRSGWVNYQGQVTYNEREVVPLNKKEATSLMSSFYEKERQLWRYMRLVPIGKGPEFPLVNGF